MVDILRRGGRQATRGAGSQLPISQTTQEPDWVSWGWAIGALGGGVGKAIERLDAVDNYKANVKALQISYNWAVNEGQRQAVSVNEALRSELFNQQLNARLNQSNVDASLSAAGREGRTAGKIQQSMKAHEGISAASATSAAKQKQADIASQMQAAYVQTSLRVNELYNQTKTSFGGDILGSLIGSISGGMSGAQTMRGFSLYF